MRTKFLQRKVNSDVETRLIDQGFHPLLSRVLASREYENDISPEAFVGASLSSIDPPTGLNDIDKAADRLVKAIKRGETIIVVSDFDADGESFMSVVLTAFKTHFNVPAHQVEPFIGDRLKEGYGLSDKLVDRILSAHPEPTLVITGDCGSSDEARIARLKALGCDVIVTDHHHFPDEGPPVSAFAVVSPIHPDSTYPDKSIAGGMVGFLLMAILRTKLIEAGFLSKDTPKLSELLDFVSIATVADCVSMASKNNRAVVKYGLNLINQKRRPSWHAVMEDRHSPVIATDIAFKIAPMLNADGRLSDAFGSVSFLMAESFDDAQRRFHDLEVMNEQRKLIQKEMVTDAKEKVLDRLSDDDFSVSVYLPNGHPGVSGIVASKLKEAFGRPSVVLAPSAKDRALLTGSVRGIDYVPFHARDALQSVANQCPGIFPNNAFGGHAGAAGLSIGLERLKEFQEAFEFACADQLLAHELSPVVITDGDIGDYAINLELADVLETLEPYGRHFEKPVFSFTGYLLNIETMGDGTHARIDIGFGEGKEPVRCTWFNFIDYPDDPMPFDIGQHIRVAVTISKSAWKGKERVDCTIEAAEALDS